MDEYDVAISYARNDREIAEGLASRLAARGLRVFYDKDRAEMLWGERLGDVLTELYGRAAIVVVVLVSCHYGSSRWTMLERNAARSRLGAHDTAGTVLPLCLDDTEPVGLELLGRQHLRPGEDPMVIDDLIARIVTQRALARPGAPPMIGPGNSRDHLTNQPSLAVHGAQGGGAVHARVTSKTSVGLGAFGMTGLLVAVIAALTGVGWLAFEGIRSLPRDDQGRVTVFGMPVPVPFAPAGSAAARGEGENGASRVGSDDGDTAASAGAPPPTGVPETAAAELAGRLDGLWHCWNDGRRSADVTFTETRRATLVDNRTPDKAKYNDTPFSEWSYKQYILTSPKTIHVGDGDVHFELDDTSNRLLLIGGHITLKCQKQRV